jgi:hypothetical protein
LQRRVFPHTLKADPMKTAEELFLDSFEGDNDDEAAWDAVRALRLRNTDDVFRLAVAYCRSEAPKQRARALDVLAQLGAGKPLLERLDAEEWAPGDEMTAGKILDRKSDTPVEDLRAGLRNLLDSK